MKLKNKTKYLINAGCFFYVEVYFVVLIINYLLTFIGLCLVVLLRLTDGVFFKDSTNDSKAFRPSFL